jgi:hypothetical protein
MLSVTIIMKTGMTLQYQTFWNKDAVEYSFQAMWDDDKPMFSIYTTEPEGKVLVKKSDILAVRIEKQGDE